METRGNPNFSSLQAEGAVTDAKYPDGVADD
jgi:hypothetical protein